jgi:iron uptake system EfeUOB component EfeO/EfeM
VRTSSPYVEGNRVTLLDIDMDQLLKDPDALQKMDALPFGPAMSISGAREALAQAGVKGIKVNDPNITIEMR